MDWQLTGNIEKSEIINFEESLEQLEELFNYLLNLINLYPENLKTAIIFDQWSLKDILAHFIGWNKLTTDDIKRTLKGKTKDNIWIDDAEIDLFNKTEVNKRSTLNWDEVLNEFIISFEELFNTYKSIPPEFRKANLNPNEEGFPISLSLMVDVKHFIYHIFEIETKISEII